MVDAQHVEDAEHAGHAVVDDAPTGPIALPVLRHLTLVTRPPADMIPGAAPSTPSEEVDGAPAAITPEDRARAWADAPGEFARTGPVRIARIEPPRLLTSGPADGWGPWPADPEVARPRSVPLPVIPPPAPPRKGTSALLISTIVLLVVMLAVLGVALVRPDVLGLSGVSPLAGGGEPAAQVVPGSR